MPTNEGYAQAIGLLTKGIEKLTAELEQKEEAIRTLKAELKAALLGKLADMEDPTS